MKINFVELKFSIKLATDKKYPDLLAYVSIKFIDEENRYFSCNGFTIRTSKFDQSPYIVPPSKKFGAGFFKFNLIEKSLWNKISKEILEQYEYESIPVCNE